MDISLLVANYVTALLSVDEDSVLVGRTNFKQDTPSTDLIVVGTLVKGIPIGRSKSFDGELEKMTYTISVKGNFTLDFYGDNAETQAFKFMLLLSSEKGFELQKTHSITLYHIPKLTNLKKIEGKTQTNREQLEVVVHYNISEVVDTKRIDTADLEVLNDK